MNKKLTQQEYIDKVSKFHNYKFNYSLVKYTKMKDYITIICPTHGEFQQKADNHTRWGCSQCTYMNAKENLINIANINHNYKYDYSKVNYINNRVNVEIICPNHGSFKVGLGAHALHKHSCPKCTATAVDDAKYIHTCGFCNLELKKEDRFISKSNNPRKSRFHKKCKFLYDKNNQLIKDYNIDLKEYHRMYNNQNGLCKICNTEIDLYSKITHVDHCHNSLIVRGLLCSNCNSLLGFAKDNINILNSAILYLKTVENVFRAI